MHCYKKYFKINLVLFILEKYAYLKIDHKIFEKENI